MLKYEVLSQRIWYFYDVDVLFIDFVLISDEIRVSWVYILLVSVYMCVPFKVRL